MNNTKDEVIMNSLKIDKNQAYEQWENLKQLIKDSELEVQQETDYNISVSVADSFIELKHTTNIDGTFVQIELHEYCFSKELINDEYNNKNHYFQTLYESIHYVYQIIHEIEREQYKVQ